MLSDPACNAYDAEIWVAKSGWVRIQEGIRLRGDGGRIPDQALMGDGLIVEENDRVV